MLIPPDDAVYISTVIVFCVASLNVTSRLTLPRIEGCKSRVLSEFGVKSNKEKKKLYKKAPNIKLVKIEFS